MISIKKLLLLAVALSYLVGQPALAASNEGLMIHSNKVERQTLNYKASEPTSLAIDSLTVKMNQPITSFPYTQDFEGFETCSMHGACPLSEEWSNPTDDDIDWTVDVGGTSSNGTGPSVDHNPGNSEGKYLYTEAPLQNNKTAHLVSPQIVLPASDAYELSFWYHMYGSTMGTMHVDVSTDNGATWSHDIIPSWTDNQDAWQEQVVNLGAYVGQSQFRFRIRGITGSIYGDMAIDNVSIAQALRGVRLIEFDNSTNLFEGRITDSYQIGLNTIPAGDVTIQISADAQSEVSLDGSNFASSQTITLNDAMPQQITVQAVDDGNPEGAHTSTLTHTISATNDPTDYRTSLAIDSLTVNINEPLYVNDDATGAADGSSWENAYPTLQDALAVATSGDEIWVAAGVYYPDEGSGQTNDERTSTFQLISGVTIYGGFDGTESEYTERDFLANMTLLSGDIDGNDTNQDQNGIISDVDDITGDNAYHVVMASNTDNSAILDGFIINAGNANGPSEAFCALRCGGGIYNRDGSPTLKNLTISANFASGGGGGLYLYESDYGFFQNITVSNNVSGGGGGFKMDFSNINEFENIAVLNNSAGNGGGFRCWYSGGNTFTNITISGNESSNGSGGGFHANKSGNMFINMLMSSNHSNGSGGGYYNFQGSSDYFINSIFVNNRSKGNGGALHKNYSVSYMKNVIIWNNQAAGSTDSTSASIYNNYNSQTISHSLIANSGGSGAGWQSELGTDGGNNIDASPLFVMDGSPSTVPPTIGDYRLLEGSPALDAGDNSAIEGIETDLAGNPRIQNGTVDMGAYEGVYNTLQVDAGASQSADEGQEVQFEGTYTDFGQDLTTTDVSIEWDFGDGNTAIDTLTPVHTYLDDGDFTVMLTVTDAEGASSSDSLEVTVSNVAPVVEAGSDMTATAGEVVDFTGTFTDPGFDDTHTIAWDFGDGNSATDTLMPSHTYNSLGTFVVSLIVTDDEGAMGEDQLTVTVIDEDATSVTLNSFDKQVTINWWLMLAFLLLLGITALRLRHRASQQQ